MSDKEYFLDFHTGDWIKDQAVSRCAPATRGVWIDLICAMHDDRRSGKLSGTPDQLARIGRCSTAELAQALIDLQTTGAADVTQRNDVVTVINRRMFRDAQKREAARLRVAKCRSKSDDCNADVAQMSRDGPMGIGNGCDSFFSGDLPSILDSPEFRKSLGAWLAYKDERRDTYKPAGLKAMVSRAAKLAASHGLAAVMDAMERAAGNRWAGWDQPSLFPAKGHENGRARYGDGQVHNPSPSDDPARGKL